MQGINSMGLCAPWADTYLHHQEENFKLNQQNLVSYSYLTA